MKVSYNWLKEYVNTTVSPEELGEKMTRAGIELDAIEYRGRELKNVVVAEIVSCEAHPESRKLHICRVNTGSEELQIVCGAPNAREGIKVALALPGAELPGGIKIGIAKLAGIESSGMLCSGAELGIDERDNAGIMELPAEFKLGEDIVKALALEDAVLDFELTPNRADCMGMLNVAREVGSITGEEVCPPQIAYAELGPDINTMFKLRVEANDLCPRYTARLVQGVKIAPSPQWMQNYLLAAGMRPINNVVDISNFVMLELNHPIHTFDYQTLKGHEIIVRRAAEGEQMETLDGKMRDLDTETLMIADAERPVCIAGIMGGMETEVTDSTTDILIEAACFNSKCIRRSARKYNIPSEASMRFEKGVDVDTTDLAARRVAQLLVELCGGVAARGCVDVYPEPVAEKKITLSVKKLNNLLGTDYTLEDAAEIMRRLNFPMERVGEDLLVFVPNYRLDITIPEDLIEEIARLKGYDNIPTSLPDGAMTQGGRDAKQSFVYDLTHKCAALGLREAVCYSFISPDEWDKLLLAENHAWRNVKAILNPINEDQSIMRTSLLPGLLNSLSRNVRKRNQEVALFEEGVVFLPQANEELADEDPRLGFVLYGAEKSAWNKKPVAFDFFYAKGIIDALFAPYGIAYSLERPDREAYPFLHSGKSAVVLVNGEIIGYFGELHPTAAANYDLDGGIAAELRLLPLLAVAKTVPVCESISKYPAVTRDICVIGEESVPAEEAAKLIRSIGGEILKSVELFDVYQGASLGEGKRSLAFALNFQSVERTLTDKEIDSVFEQIVSELNSQLGLALR